jgi:hypothetical protein
MDTGPNIVLNVPFFFGVAAAWALVWAWIGWLLADRRRPRRFIFVEDSGAWTVAKLHSVDDRADDAPIDMGSGEEQPRSAEMG